MGTTFTPGELSRGQADALNELAARAAAMARLSVSGGLSITRGISGQIDIGAGVIAAAVRPPTLECRVLNGSGAFRPAGSVLAYHSPPAPSAGNPAAFNADPLIYGKVPFSPHNDFCVTLADLQDLQIGPCVVAGLATVLVDTANDARKGEYAQCVIGDTTRLRRSTFGRARIFLGVGSTGQTNSFFDVNVGSSSEAPIYARLTGRFYYTYSFVQVLFAAQGTPDMPSGVTGTIALGVPLVSPTVLDGCAVHIDGNSGTSGDVEAELMVGAIVQLWPMPGGIPPAAASGGAVEGPKANWMFGPYHKVVHDVVATGGGGFTVTYKMAISTRMSDAQIATTTTTGTTGTSSSTTTTSTTTAPTTTTTSSTTTTSTTTAPTTTSSTTTTTTTTPAPTTTTTTSSTTSSSTTTTNSTTIA